MGSAFTKVIHDHAVGADQTVHQRLHGHSPKPHFTVRDHHTGLHIVAGHHSHLQPVVHDLDCQPGFRHLAAHDLHLFPAREQREDGGSHLQVVNAAVAVRKQRAGDSAGAIVHAANHIGLVAVTEPGVDVFRQQLRLLRSHHVVILRRDVQRGADLTVEQIRGSEYFHLTGIQMGDVECAAIGIKME